MNKRFFRVGLAACGLGLASGAAGQTPAATPDAAALVRAASAFHGSLSNFSVTCTRVIDPVRRRSRAYDVAASLPDRLRVDSDSYLDPVVWSYAAGQVSITRVSTDETATHPALTADFPFAPAEHPDPNELGLHHTAFLVDLLSGRLPDRLLAQAAPDGGTVAGRIRYNGADCHRVRLAQNDQTAYELYVQTGATPFIHLIRHVAAPPASDQILAEEIYRRWQRNVPDLDRTLAPAAGLSGDVQDVFAQGVADCDRVLEKLRNGETPTAAELARCGEAPPRYFDAVSRATGRSMNVQFPEPERTQFYLLAIQAGLVDWPQHGGWAFKSDLRHLVVPRLETLYAEKPEPLTAFALLFPALERGDVARAGEWLDRLLEQDDFLARKAVEWSVRAATRPDWFVEYYLDKGQPGRAEELAGHAAATGEQFGFELKARILERQERFTEAEACYKEIEKRHDYVGALVNFYVKYRDRQDDTGATFQQRLDELIARCFPNGLRKVRPDDFTAPPRAGLVFTEENGRILRAGLGKGTVIVALDGHAVDNLNQYYVVRELDSDNPRMELIVWTGTEYKTVALSIPKRRFGLNLQTYAP